MTDTGDEISCQSALCLAKLQAFVVVMAHVLSSQLRRSVGRLSPEPNKPLSIVRISFRLCYPGALATPVSYISDH